MAETFIHPQSEKEIFGEQLVPGDVLREGDVYPSTTGEWQEIVRLVFQDKNSDRNVLVFGCVLSSSNTLCALTG